MSGFGYKRSIWLLLLLFCSLSINAAPLTSLQSTLTGATTQSASTTPSLEEQAAQWAEQAKLTESEITKLRTQIEQAPQHIASNQRALTQLKAQPEPELSSTYSRQSSVELEQVLQQRIEQVADWQRELAAANSLIINAQNKPERSQAEINEHQQRIQEINTLLKATGSKQVNAERRLVLQAELIAITRSGDLRRLELSGNSILLDLGKSQRDLLVEKIRRGEKETLALQARINDLRREQTEQTVAELSANTEPTQNDSLLAKQNRENLQLSNYLLRATDRLNILTKQNLQARQQLDSLAQMNQALDEQVAVLKGSLLLSRVLYQQKQSLPHIILDKNLPDEIADLRLYQFQINQSRNEIENSSLYIDQLLQQYPDEHDTSELRQALLGQLAIRSELLDRLNRELGLLLNEAINLQLNQRQLQQTVTSISKTLDEQMFWIASNRPLDMAWFTSAPGMLEKQLEGTPWLATGKELVAGLAKRPLLFLPLVLLIAVLLWYRPAITRKLEQLSKEVGHFRKDSHLHTPLTLLLNVLIALPVALALALCGFILETDAYELNHSLGEAFYEMAQAWLMFFTAYRMLSPSGAAELHFRWSVQQVSFLREQMKVLGFIVLALVAVVSITEGQTANLANDVLGILIVVASYGLMSFCLMRITLKGPHADSRRPLRTLAGLIFGAVPLVLMGAVFMGYYYTALKLTDRLIDTLYLIMIWVVLEATLIRGLTLAARRVAYKRAVAHRQRQEQEGEESSDIPTADEYEPDLSVVNQQSLRLIHLCTVVLFALSLYWVWADLISVMSYLDNVTLYELSTTSGERLISLKDLLGALTVVVITIALARNLPGLLEVFVLSRLQLAQGSAYATATLLSYILVGVGIVSTLSTLGVSWDKLQWLVAALSVGLGFGLQEIFANFISGLIILFERPVRIGDVVTIGNLSGTVSRIRIRATTITDFDHKEIIVPNKTFVTDQLLNWSLSDTVTRVTLKIGVLFGSDLDEVRGILFAAAENNSRVLKDPEPQVLFLSFGDSRLEHELRMHVRTLSDRNPAIDETNRYIDKAFREAGIKIAYRQLDIHVQNAQGQPFLLARSSAATAPDNP